MRIEVTADDLKDLIDSDDPVHGRCRTCPVTLALSRATGISMVTGYTASRAHDLINNHTCPLITLPNDVTNKIWSIDEIRRNKKNDKPYEKMQPFSFEIDDKELECVRLAHKNFLDTKNEVTNGVNQSISGTP